MKEQLLSMNQSPQLNIFQEDKLHKLKHKYNSNQSKFSNNLKVISKLRIILPLLNNKLSLKLSNHSILMNLKLNKELFNTFSRSHNKLIINSRKFLNSKLFNMLFNSHNNNKLSTNNLRLN